MATCRHQITPESRPQPGNVRLCGAPGCERSIKGGLAKVSEVLCDYHAEMWVKRGFLVTPYPHTTGRR